MAAQERIGQALLADLEAFLVLREGALGEHDLGDVGEGEDHAAHGLGQGAVRQGPRDEPAVPFRTLDVLFPGFVGGQHLPGHLDDVGAPEEGHDIPDGPAQVAFDEPVHFRGGRRVAGDAQLLVQEDGGDGRGPQEVLEVAVGQAQLADLLLELVVEGGELLVHRPELLLGGLQLLVGGLQLLVGGAEGLVGGTQFVHRGLQFGLGDAELHLHLVQEGIVRGRGQRREGGGRLQRLQDHREHPGLPLQARHGAHRHPQALLALARIRPDQGRGRTGAGGIRRLGQEVAQLPPEGPGRALEQVAGGRPHGGVEEPPDAAGAEQHIAQLVDDGARRGVLLQEHPLEKAVRGGGGRAGGSVRPGAVAVEEPAVAQGKIQREPVLHLPAQEDAVHLVHRLEQVGTGGQPLRGPQEEDPPGPEGEMEQGHQLALQVRLEVDEDVAAGDEVQRGERRIPHEVLHGEYAHVPQFLGDAEEGPLGHEEPGQAIRGYAPQGIGGVPAGLGVHERAGVDVGGEDPHRARGAEGVQLFAHQHRDGIGLLPRAAPRHPDAEGLGVGLARRQLGQQVVGEAHERHGIPEEFGDADEQVVQEGLGLFGGVPQVGEVVLERGRARGPGPVLDPALEGPRLVPAEVVVGPLGEDLADVLQDLGLVPGFLEMVVRHVHRRRVPVGSRLMAVGKEGCPAILSGPFTPGGPRKPRFRTTGPEAMNH